MHTHTNKSKESKSQAAANTPVQQSAHGTFQFEDNRPETLAQRRLSKVAKTNGQSSQLKSLQVKQSKSSPIQRLESGDDYSHKKLGKEAVENGWWEKDSGEFLAPPEITDDYDEDTYQYEMHYHQYSGELEKSDDEVSISGHGVWAKSDNKSRRQKYNITSKKNGGGHWYIDESSALGDQELGFEADKNPDAKGKLLGAFGALKEIFKDTMNSDGDDSDDD